MDKLNTFKDDFMLYTYIFKDNLWNNILLLHKQNINICTPTKKISFS